MWKPVSGWEGVYEVSDSGEVRSLDRLITAKSPFGVVGTRRFKGRTLAAAVSGSGYRVVVLTRPGKRQYANVHQLVMAAFRGAAPAGMEVCHNDGVKTNNRLDNLRYDTRKSNAADCTAHGQRVVKRGGDSHAAKLTKANVEFIRANYTRYSQRELARRFGVTHKTVAAVINGGSWRE